MKSLDAAAINPLNDVENGVLETSSAEPNLALGKNVSLRQVYNVEGIKVDPFLVYKMRKSEAEALLANTSVVKGLVYLDDRLSQVKGWKERAANEDAVALVKASTDLQTAALDPKTISAPEAAESNLNVQLQKVDEVLQRFQKRNGLPVDITKEIDQAEKVEDKLLQGNGVDEVMRRFKERNPDVPGIAQNETVKQDASTDVLTAKGEPKQGVDEVFENAPNRERVVFPAFSDQIQYVPRVVKEEPKNIEVSPVMIPAVENNAAKSPAVENIGTPKDTFETALERGNKRMENAAENLENRKKGSKERLKSMGLSVARGLEALSTIGPKKKLALGVLFAGGAAATGGALALLPGAFSAASFASKFYTANVQRAQENNVEANKAKMAGRAIILGTLAAIGTSFALGAAGEYVADNYADQISSAKDAVKGFFGNLFSSSTPPMPDLGAFNEAVPDVAPMGGINTGTDFGFDPNTEVGSNVSGNVVEIGSTYMAPSHTFIPGDNLTKVISSEIIAKLPEAAGANPENIIQNLLNLAETGDPQFEALKKFLVPGAADPFGLVQVGDTVDLEAIKKMITTPLPEYDGQTLIQHARKIAGK